ncbi:sensor histidine kinase [Pseudotabrizicola formosa]|uniref:sensor histidine kinase n=1 Tax=Pseudotabrizicola formosa TaxID=2030009 RepID=UPI000CD288DE|nr:sensor histidine kinase [Pseudotabrizicola formosa]
MRLYSLRRRLLLWLLLATLALGLIALMDTWREALRTAQSVSDRVLVGSALAIAERVTLDEAGGLEVDIPFSSLEMLTSTAQDKVFYRVDGPVGHFLTGYKDLVVVEAPVGGVGFADGFYGDVGIRSATLMREVSTGAASIPFSVTVAESTLARSALAQAILVRSALRLAVLMLGVAILVWVAVTVALRPLTRLGDAIAERSPGDLRPITANTPEEVEPLVVAINLFMDRLQTALDALRNFTGNASHQLRTPLAVVRTQLALIDRSIVPDEAAAASGKATSALERAERVLSHLLVLARVDASAGAATLAPVDLVGIAKEVVSELVPGALSQGIDLGFEGPDTARVAADPILLAELLRNLVSNAITYAGRDAVVTVRVQAMPDRIILEVEDNGPGLSQDLMAAFVQSRRGVSRPLPHLDFGPVNGMGLGLAVAVEISELFGGRLHLTKARSETGLLASIAFAPVDI